MTTVNITDNLESESINKNHALSSFDVRNEMLDKILDDELYNQELYNGGNGSRYNIDGGNIEEIKTDLFDIIKKSTNFDVSNIDRLEEIDVSNIALAYNKTADMYRNQKAVDYYVQGKKKKFETRNKELLQDVDNRIRQKEIFTYYYKKYNAQKKILFYIVIASILTICLTYLNKRFKFLVTDTIFILAIGILFAILVINICAQLFEIFFRNNINFDEYDFMFQNKSNVNNIIEKSDKENEREKCDAEIKAYQGR